MHITNNDLTVNTSFSTTTSSAGQDISFLQGNSHTGNQLITPISDRKLEQLTDKTSWRITENIPLKSNLNFKEFVEVTRRIKQNKHDFIDKQLTLVNSQDLSELQQIYYQPELILTTKNTFFSDKKFPFIALKALQLGYISVFEFASLQSWHEIYQEQKLLNPNSEPQLYNLFNKDNSRNEVAWAIIISSAASCDTILNKYLINMETSKIIANLQSKITSASAIDRCFLLFKIILPINPKGLYKIIINTGVRFCSTYKDSRISPSIALYQRFLDVVFTENISRINPVISISSPKDIRDGGYKFLRDFTIPFPGHSFPEEVHGHYINEILEFQYHDLYHIFHMCMMSPKAIIFCLQIGDALLGLRNRCNETIKCLKNLISQKLASLESFKTKLTTMQEKNRVEAEQRLFSEFYRLTKILNLLVHMRKAYGQFKFIMYDADINHLENREPKLVKKYGENGVFLFNIILLLSRKNTEPPLISGFLARLAGRVVIKEADKILDMRSACEYFINHFNSLQRGYNEEIILDFLTSGLRSIKEDT